MNCIQMVSRGSLVEMKLLWLLALVSAVHAYPQDDSSDLCQVHFNNWKELLLDHQQQRVSIVEEANTKLVQAVITEMQNLEKKERDGKVLKNIENKQDEVQEEVENVAYQVQVSSKRTENGLRNVRSKLDEVAEIVVESLSGFKSIMSDVMTSNLKSFSDDIKQNIQSVASTCNCDKNLDDKLEQFKSEFRNEVRAALMNRLDSNMQITQNNTFNASADMLPNTGIKKQSFAKQMDCIAWKNKLSDVAENLTRLDTGIYLFNSKDWVPWSIANEMCTKRGLALATFSNKTDMETVKMGAPEVGDYDPYWVAATDNGRQPGEFYWPDGRAVESNMWHSNTNDTEPDDFGQGKVACAFFIKQKINLYDNLCESKNLHYVCEVSPEFYKCL